MLDFRRRPVIDPGLTGSDAGKGGRYMVIAPQSDASTHVDSGRNVIQAASNNVLIGLRIPTPDTKFAEGFKAGSAMSRLGEDSGLCASSKGLIESGARPRREGGPFGTAWRRSSASSLEIGDEVEDAAAAAGCRSNAKRRSVWIPMCLSSAVRHDSRCLLRLTTDRPARASTPWRVR